MTQQFTIHDLLTVTDVTADKASCHRGDPYECRWPSRACPACLAAKHAALQRGVDEQIAIGRRWLAGMEAREKRALQIRREMGWSREQWPTDREALDDCTIE